MVFFLLPSKIHEHGTLGIIKINCDFFFSKKSHTSFSDKQDFFNHLEIRKKLLHLRLQNLQS